MHRVFQSSSESGQLTEVWIQAEGGARHVPSNTDVKACTTVCYVATSQLHCIGLSSSCRRDNLIGSINRFLESGIDRSKGQPLQQRVNTEHFENNCSISHCADINAEAIKMTMMPLAAHFSVPTFTVYINLEQACRQCCVCERWDKQTLWHLWHWCEAQTWTVWER